MVANTERQTELLCRIEAPVCWECDEEGMSYDMRLVTVEREGLCRTFIFQCSGCDDVSVRFMKVGW
jgi:hypothetical protein